MFVFNADKALAKIGFKKVYESDLVVQYERDEKHAYTHVLELQHKASGKHLIQSFDKGTNAEGFNHAVGITAKEAALAIVKMRRLGWK